MTAELRYRGQSFELAVECAADLGGGGHGLRRGVVAAYLFGSQARGDPGPLSDVDSAVWLDEDPEPDRCLSRQLALSAQAALLLGTDEVELVVLNGAPPLLAQRVIRDGEVLAERSALARVRLETEAIIRYLDTIPRSNSCPRIGISRRRSTVSDRNEAS